MQSTQSAIELKQLQYYWQQNAVLDIEHWAVDKGQGVFLYGPSGSGKTTLLNLISGVLKPASGQINVLGQDITQLSQAKNDRFRANHIGVIFQQFNLLPYLSVLDNIRLAAYFGMKSETDNPLFQSILDKLGLTPAILQQRASQLSVGQQQRVAVARALINQPEILVADEPTSALDTELRDSFVELLLQCAQQNNSTVIFVSHDKSLANHFDKQQDLRDINKLAVEIN